MVDLEDISNHFKSGKENKALFDKVIQAIQEFGKMEEKSEWATTPKWKSEFVLLHKLTMHMKKTKVRGLAPLIGYSGSSADIVAYFEQTPLDILNLKDNFFYYDARRKLKNGVIYPCVIIQIDIARDTGKLQSENRKAQIWRELFPRALLVFICSRKRTDKIVRDLAAFDAVFTGFESIANCEKGLKLVTQKISNHIESEWFHPVDYYK